MDGERFDTFVRALATASRRSALRLLAGGALGAAGLARLGAEEAAAKRCETHSDCPRNSVCCDRRCTDTSKDDKHCGKCGRRCKGKETCCGGKCTDVSRNRKHCGKCGNRCKRDEACERGKCKQKSCPENEPIRCPAGSKKACCPEELSECCPVGAKKPCCPESHPVCCKPGEGGTPPEDIDCCSAGSVCTPEGCG